MQKALDLTADRDLVMKKMNEILAGFPEVVITTHKLSTNAMETKVMEECYYPLVEAFSSSCFNLGCNNYVFRVIRYFTDLCNNQVPVQEVLNRIDMVCDKSVHETKCGIE